MRGSGGGGATHGGGGRGVKEGGTGMGEIKLDNRDGHEKGDEGEKDDGSSDDEELDTHGKGGIKEEHPAIATGGLAGWSGDSKGEMRAKDSEMSFEADEIKSFDARAEKVVGMTFSESPSEMNRQKSRHEVREEVSESESESDRNVEGLGDSFVGKSSLYMDRASTISTTTTTSTTTAATTTTITTTSTISPSIICDGVVDAAVDVRVDGISLIYFFRDELVYEIDQSTKRLRSGFPKPINDVFGMLDVDGETLENGGGRGRVKNVALDRVDAALCIGRVLHLISGRFVFKFRLLKPEERARDDAPEVEWRLDSGSPSPVETEWEAAPNTSIEAAFTFKTEEIFEVIFIGGGSDSDMSDGGVNRGNAGSLRSDGRVVGGGNSGDGGDRVTKERKLTWWRGLEFAARSGGRRGAGKPKNTFDENMTKLIDENFDNCGTNSPFIRAALQTNTNEFSFFLNDGVSVIVVGHWIPKCYHNDIPWDWFKGLCVASKGTLSDIMPQLFVGS